MCCAVLLLVFDARVLCCAVVCRAEDSSVNQKVVSRMLAGHCLLEIVSNGAEAVQRVKTYPNRYALIFMDINVRHLLVVPRVCVNEC